MNEKVKSFLCLTTSRQIKYLKEGDFNHFNRDEQIEFLKVLLNADPSSKTTACALKILRELKFRDKFFFRKFLYHVDSSVANAARKAIDESVSHRDTGVVKIIDMIAREKSENRAQMVKAILRDRKKLNEHVLISLLKLDDFRVRETILKDISSQHILDESILTDAVKGAVWYVRASVVEILGRRKSKYVYNLAEDLVHDSNVEVKLKLIEALAGLERNQSRIYLEQLKEDANHVVRKEAQRVLAAI